MFPVYCSYMCDTLKSRHLKVNYVGKDGNYSMSVSAQLCSTGVKAVTLAAVLRSNPSVLNCGVGHILTQMFAIVCVKHQPQILYL